MEHMIFLIENDLSLRANITELLELEGYQVTSLSLEEVESVFNHHRGGLVIVNALTLTVPVEALIQYLSDRVDGIAVLCSDDENPLLHGARISKFHCHLTTFS